MPVHNEELLKRVEALETGVATQAATLAGAQATQAAVQGGMAATGAATQAGNIATMVAGWMGLFLGIVVARSIGGQK